jgi:hypothetical protein
LPSPACRAASAVVHGLCHATALRVGLQKKADLNLIDFERLALRPPEISHDLPGGEHRRIARTAGTGLSVMPRISGGARNA